MASPGSFIHIMKLVRWQNLLIAAGTMILMRYSIIEPLLSRTGVMLINDTRGFVPMTLQMEWYDFAALVAAVVLITAAGYVINDYFDIRTDLINRGKVIVGSKVSRRSAIMWHSILNIAGILAGIYVSWKSGYIWFGLLFVFVSGLLYFYSASYKREFLIGNLIVSFLTAMVPFLVIVFEWPALKKFYLPLAVEMPDLTFLLWWIGSYSFFAFITTLSREIIKDIEDFEGDKAFGRNTLPVLLGIRASKLLASALMGITAVSLYIVWYLFLNDKITLIYLSVAICLPLLFNIVYLFRASTVKDLHLSSTIMKAVMLSGILYSVVVKIMISFNIL